MVALVYDTRRIYNEPHSPEKALALNWLPFIWLVWLVLIVAQFILFFWSRKVKRKVNLQAAIILNLSLIINGYVIIAILR